jgi:hypothetical protein
VEDDRYALAALRSLDRHPIRAGLVADPTTYPWSSCAAYAVGAANPLISLHPSYLALSRYPKVRQRHYRALLAPADDPAPMPATRAGPPSGPSAPRLFSRGSACSAVHTENLHSTTRTIADDLAPGRYQVPVSRCLYLC